MGRAVRAVARALAVLVAVAVLAWLCAEAAPGTPGERAARAAGLLPADDSGVSAEVRAGIVAEVAHQHRLDRPMIVRLARFVGGLALLDLGRSWRDGGSVRARVGRAAAPTLVLVVGALLVAIALGLGIAVAAVERAGSRTDRALSGLAAIAIAIPPAWIALLALRTFATGSPWRWLPTGGFDTLGAAVLPVLSMAAVPAFVLARFARAELLRAERAPWAVAVRARGATRRRVILVHALRASLAGLVAVGTNLVAYSLGASLVIERVFGIHGLGSLLLDASARGDAPVVVGVAVCAGALLALASVGADAAQRALDPRLRNAVEGDRGA